jgi:hypothetical protein
MAAGGPPYQSNAQTQPEVPHADLGFAAWLAPSGAPVLGDSAGAVRALAQAFIKYTIVS